MSASVTLAWALITVSAGYSNQGDITVIERYPTLAKCEEVIKVNKETRFTGRDDYAFRLRCINLYPIWSQVVAQDLKPGMDIKLEDGRTGEVISAKPARGKPGFIKIEFHNKLSSSFRYFIEIVPEDTPIEYLEQ